MRPLSSRRIAGLAVALWMLHSVNAAPITGSLDFSGGAKLNSDTLAQATEVQSWALSVVTTGGVTPGSVLDSTINDGDAVVMSAPWSFSSGLPQLWQVGGFTFDLSSADIGFQSGFFLAVEGKGWVSGNGYDPTPGSWYFTSQGQGIAGGQFSFSSTTVSRPVSVPEGGSSALLLSLAGAGLAAAGCGRRRRSRNQG